MDLTANGLHKLDDCPGGGCRAAHTLRDGAFVDDASRRLAAMQVARALLAHTCPSCGPLDRSMLTHDCPL